jgi:hypothetical protein
MEMTMTAILDITRPKFRRDWSAYLVIADQHDDAGNDVRARVLRRQGELMRQMVERITPVCKEGPQKKTRRLVGTLPFGVSWQCNVARSQATLFVRWAFQALPEGGCRRRSICLHMARDLIACEGREDYLPERIREVFEAIGFEYFMSE